jgi:U3 small nucleolar RNA-associated protein 19
VDSLFFFHTNFVPPFMIPWKIIIENNSYFLDAENFKCDTISTKKALNKVWACVIHWELTPQLHKQFLVVLLERMMPYLEKPALMTDILMDSLDVDGPTGLLALQGIFTLVIQQNLEYPNLFTKLYSMFEPEILHTKYKARLFYLSDLFLSST